MRKLFKKQSRKVGLPPGTLIHVGDIKSSFVKMKRIEYNAFDFKEEQIQEIRECAYSPVNQYITWINIDGLHKTELIHDIGRQYGIHSLVLEDILNTNHRPKMDDYDDYIHFTLRLLLPPERGFDLERRFDIVKEQVSIILGKRFVLTFQEKESSIFDPVIDRLKKSKGLFRNAGTDYLTYTLMDTIVDSYFYTLEKIGDELEDLEEELVDNPSENTLNKIHRMKNEIIILSRSIRPVREMIIALRKSDSPLIQEETHVFLKDLYDHIIQIIDIIESYRDMLTGMLDVYLSHVSLRLNEIMKVLTIFASIFIPLTFIVGIYGMNFRYMPELKWDWSYPAVWLIMIALTVGMLFYFKRKKWL